MDTFNNKSISFASVPLFVQDVIMEKFKYKQFAVFECTCQLAAAVCFRNQRLRFPIDADQIVILNGHLCINHGGIPFEACEKVIFKAAQIFVNDTPFDEKTCNFLLSLGDIKTLACNFPEIEDSHTADFFKKAKIQCLKMTTLNLDNWLGLQFPYDSSNIEQIEVDDCLPLSLDVIFSLRARRSVSFSSVWFSTTKIFLYIQKMMTTTEKFDLTLKNYIPDLDDIGEFYDFIHNNGTVVGSNQWRFWKKSDDDKPFMEIEMNREAIKFKIF